MRWDNGLNFGVVGLVANVEGTAVACAWRVFGVDW